MYSYYKFGGKRQYVWVWKSITPDGKLVEFEYNGKELWYDPNVYFYWFDEPNEVKDNTLLYKNLIENALTGIYSYYYTYYYYFN